MQPIAEDIAKLAVYDPVAAYGIALGIPRTPITMNSVVSFSSFALNQIPLSTGLDTTLAFRTWIDNLTYSVYPVGQFQGNIFQTQYVAYLRQATGVSVRATVQAGPKYLVSQYFTPLENFVNVFASRYPAGWTLYKQQNVLTEFVLTQVPGGDTANLSQYNVTLTWNGWQFLDPTLDEMDASTARECLQNMGFQLPKACTGVRANMG
jgi:hypothetical protein